MANSAQQTLSHNRKHPVFDESCRACWDRRLAREGLSLKRGNARNRLAYVDPSDLWPVPDPASDPEKILLAKEKVKLISLGYKKGDYWVSKTVKVKA